jgi:hypothetical protein
MFNLLLLFLYFKYLCEFKNRLLTANFFSYKISLDENNSIENFEIDDSLKYFCDIEAKYETLESTLSKKELLHLMVIIVFFHRVLT